MEHLKTTWDLKVKLSITRYFTQIPWGKNMSMPDNQVFHSESQNWLQRHPLVSYFCLAYAISWILSIPFILSEWGILSGDFRPFFIVKSFGPFLAAYILTGFLEGKDGVKRFRKSVRQWQTGWLWYLITLLVIPALLLGGILIQPGSLAGFKGITPLILVNYAVTYLVVFFGGGPLGEEPGWRGFALPRLQKQYGPLAGTLILSALWTCWHLPDFLTSAQGGGPGTGISAFLVNFPIFLALVTAIAVILTWIFNNTRGSVFLSILAHASVNTPQVVLVPLFPAVTTTRLNLAALIGFSLPAVVLLLVTHGRLGYTLKD